MPARNEIQDEIIRRKSAGQDDIRREYLSKLANLTGHDTILYASAFSSPSSSQIPGVHYSITSDDIQGFMTALHRLKGDSLDLILHSPGGSMEAADQILQYLRSKYKHIRAIVPQNAMSAATMIACACDSIVMGKHSAIGPIDPQVAVRTETGTLFVPAQAILDEFERAKSEVKADKDTIPLWATKLKAYPPGFLQMCQMTLALATRKVAGWLTQYMFAEEAQAQERSTAIADWLGKANEHMSHGRPINIQEWRAHGLKIDALEDDQALQEAVLSAYYAMLVTFQVTNCVKMVENHIGKGVYTQVKLEAVPVPARGSGG